MPVDTSPAAGPAARAANHGHDAPDLRVFVFALVFIVGGITALNAIIPKMTPPFTLDHATAMLVPSTFFLAYAVFAIPRRRDRTQGGRLYRPRDRDAAIGSARRADPVLRRPCPPPGGGGAGGVSSPRS